MSAAAAAPSPNCSSSDALRPRHRGSIRLKHRLAFAPTRPAERAGEASALPFRHDRFDVARSAQLQPTWPVRRIWPLSEVGRAFDLGVACRSRLTALPRPSATTWSPRSWWSLAILAPSVDRRNINSSGLSDMGKPDQRRRRDAPKALQATKQSMPARTKCQCLRAPTCHHGMRIVLLIADTLPFYFELRFAAGARR
jgi:hypothetical protein